MLVNCLQGWLVARSRPGSGSGKLLPSHSIRTFEVRLLWPFYRLGN